MINNYKIVILNMLLKMEKQGMKNLNNNSLKKDFYKFLLLF
jgi:hypothetical protein